MKRDEWNPNVAGCRGLFAFMVLIEHVQNSGLGSGAFWSNAFSDYYFMSFQYAVELFFCISGYVIARSLPRASGARDFLLKRLLRIVPVFGLIHLLSFAIGPILGERAFENIGVLSYFALFVSNALLLPGILDLPIVQPQAWSLSYELLFYVLACAAFFSGSWLPRTTRWSVGGLFALALCDQYPRAIFFSVGVFAVHIEQWLRAHPRAAERNPLTPLPCMVLMLTAWQAIDVISGVGPIDRMTLSSWFGDARLGLALVAYLAGLGFFVGMLRDGGSFGRLMRSRPFQFLGAISYSFYLWHPLVMFGVKRVLRGYVLPYTGDSWGKTLFFAISLVLSLAIAHVSYLLVEQRLQRVLRAWLPAPEPVLAVSPLRERGWSVSQ